MNESGLDKISILKVLDGFKSHFIEVVSPNFDISDMEAELYQIYKSYLDEYFQASNNILMLRGNTKDPLYDESSRLLEDIDFFFDTELAERDKMHFDILVELIAENCQSALPSSLGDFGGSVLRGHIKRPKNNLFNTKNYMRNEMISGFICAISLGLKINPTADDENNHKNAITGSRIVIDWLESEEKGTRGRRTVRSIQNIYFSSRVNKNFESYEYNYLINRWSKTLDSLKQNMS